LDLHSLHTGFGKRNKSCLYRSDFTNGVGKLYKLVDLYPAVAVGAGMRVKFRVGALG
jgi:hypothetical protein